MIDTDHIRTMTAAEKLMLAQQLIDSVLLQAVPLTKAQLDEIRARALALDSGESLCAPMDEVMDRLLGDE